MQASATSTAETPMGGEREEPIIDVLPEPPVTEVTKAAVGTQSGDQADETAKSQLSEPVQAATTARTG